MLLSIGNFIVEWTLRVNSGLIQMALKCKRGRFNSLKAICPRRIIKLDTIQITKLSRTTSFQLTPQSWWEIWAKIRMCRLHFWMRGLNLVRLIWLIRPLSRSFRIVDCCVTTISESRRHSMRPIRMGLVYSLQPFTTFTCLRWIEVCHSSDSSNSRSRRDLSISLLSILILIHNSLKVMKHSGQQREPLTFFKQTLLNSALPSDFSLLIRIKFLFDLKIWQITLIHERIRPSRIRALTRSMLKSLPKICTKV